MIAHDCTHFLLFLNFSSVFIRFPCLSPPWHQHKVPPPHCSPERAAAPGRTAKFWRNGGLRGWSDGFVGWIHLHSFRYFHDGYMNGKWIRLDYIHNDEWMWMDILRFYLPVVVCSVWVWSTWLQVHPAPSSSIGETKRLRRSHPSAGEKCLPKWCRQGWAGRRESNRTWWFSWRGVAAIRWNPRNGHIWQSQPWIMPNSIQFYQKCLGFQASGGVGHWVTTWMTAQFHQLWLRLDQGQENDLKNTGLKEDEHLHTMAKTAAMGGVLY